jgi:cytochrome c biogenesis protein CcmG/thiol:disulfide interchange protein DsbE
MTDVGPPPGDGRASGPGLGLGDGPGDGEVEAQVRKPRKVFLVLGIVLALIIGAFLFTSLGTSSGSGSTGSSSAPSVGDPVPSFTSQNIGPAGGSSVSVSARRGGQPTVLLFFGDWCPSCHQELPGLAAAVRSQESAGGPLAGIRVVGVDSEDTKANAKSFIHGSGVTFPVAYDPNVDITSGLFYFTGDPYAVFVRSDGTIARIVRGDTLTASSLTADERALIPSGT